MARETMKLAMVGLGRMGANLSRRLAAAGHRVVAFDTNADAVRGLVAERIEAADSLADVAAKLESPRVVWLMLPAAVTQGALDELTAHLESGDVVIDGGNSYYRDDVDRAAALAPRGIHYVDCGTSGGVWGLERGYSLMIGGEPDVVASLDPIFAAIAPGDDGTAPTPGRTSTGTASRGYLHCGPNGAGHFVKMVHNGIEYGMMASIAEGMSVLRHANAGLDARRTDAETAPLRDPRYYQYEIDVAEVAEVWRHGSVVSSWLVDLIADALARSPDLSQFAGRVSDSGEGRWTVEAAIEESVPAPVISAALWQRYESRALGEFTGQVLSAMRSEFGGHVETAG